MVPPLIGLLVVVSILPVIQAGAELIVNRSSAADLVDRITGYDVTMVDLSATALRLGLPAPDEPDGRPAWFYPVRDNTGEDRIALVRSPVAPAQLDTRQVVARLIEDPAKVDGGARALIEHGWLASGGSVSVGGRYLVEVDPAGLDVRDVGRVDDLANTASGTVVRLTLHFAGVGVATCEAGGGACQAQRLATGTGAFLQLAGDPASARAILVQTDYPASDAPMRAVGRQVPAQPQLDSLLTLPWVNRLIGWGNVLNFVYLDQDPALPINRLWLVPVLFLVLAFLLLAGRVAGYPIFIVRDDGRVPAAAAPGRAAGPWEGSLAPVPAAVSGRLSRTHGGPVDLEGAPGELRPPPSAGDGPLLVVRTPSEMVEVPLPAARRSLSGLQRGEVRWLTGRRPALWIHWFGSDARLVFEDEATMDRAEALLAGLA